jgi:membrane associated rhomboid family serine protease
MFQRVIDDLKESTSTRLQQVALTAVLAVALVIAVAFLFAAAFVFVAHAYGGIIACLAAAGLFFVIAIIVGIWHAMRKRRIEARARERAGARARNLLTDPAVLTTGLQIVRALGAKRLIPLLAVSGLALGVLMSRSAAQDETPPAE